MQVMLHIFLPSDPVPNLVFTVSSEVLNSPMIDNKLALPPPNYYTNVTQGSDLKINVTITSTGLEEVVNVTSVDVWWYNPQVNLYTWYEPPNTGNESSVIQASAFNYSSSPNPVSLQPSTSNSTIITLNIAKDAPTGQYSMYINLEAELKQSNENETSEFNVLEQAYWFSMIINPGPTA